MACSNFCTNDDLKEIETAISNDQSKISMVDRSELQTQNLEHESKTEEQSVFVGEDAQEGIQEADAKRSGFIEHYLFRTDILVDETRQEGATSFTTEKAITDEKGNVVYIGGVISKPDFVDYEKNSIIDLKPIHGDEDPMEVYCQYLRQMERYIEAYEKARGVTPEAHFVFYQANRENG
jgi:hypothetical protein